MPAKRELSMRQLRHLLRLHHDGVSVREIGRRLGVARSTIQDNLKRAAAAGLAWPLADGVTDEALERQLFGRAGVTQGQRRRVGPDWAALARELKRPGVTMTILWEEYRALGLDTTRVRSRTVLAPTAGAIAATVEKANSALTLLGFEASLSSNDVRSLRRPVRVGLWVFDARHGRGGPADGKTGGLAA